MRDADPASFALIPSQGCHDLPPMTTLAVGNLVRGMSCCDNTLIEAHDTGPVDIERALLGIGDWQARRLMQLLVARGLLHGTKDALLRIAFPLDESKRLFPHLRVPAGVAMVSDPELDAALPPPRTR